MKTLKVFLSTVLAFVYIGVFAQGQTSLSDRTKNVLNDCGKCNDAWVTQAYYQTWGSCPGTGENDACNIRLYGGGVWSTYGDLLNKVRAAFTGSRQTGKVFIFMRPVDALGFGHMGWGIMLSDGSYFCGSTENPFSPPQPKDTYNQQAWAKSISRSAKIPAGQDNSSWTMRFATEQQMFARMKSLNYSRWKGLAVSNPTILKAKSATEIIKGKGYDVTGNNCFDHTYDVITAYGIHWTKLPLKQVFPVPNEWFRRFYADNSNNGAEGWGL